jgi:DNA-binding transcriptional LysR family regulator
MNIKKYLAYIKIVETGSLTKAAEILNYTQPSISQMISSLEAEYGFPLLVRHKYGVAPTKHGEQVLKAMQEIQRGYELLNEMVNEINGVETGEVRIGAYSSIMINLIPEIVGEFKKLYPFINIHLYEGNATELDQWLEEGKIDFGIGTLHNDKWEFELLFEDQIVVVMNSQSQLANINRINLYEIEAEEFILPYTNSHFEVHQTFKKEQIQPKIAYQVKGDETIISMVRQNLGISLLPELLLRNCPSDIISKPLVNEVSRKIGILRRNQKHVQTPSVLKIIDFIKRRMNN